MDNVTGTTTVMEERRGGTRLLSDGERMRNAPEPLPAQLESVDTHPHSAAQD
jgi:hypothetical protein